MMIHRVLVFLGFAALIAALSGCATTWAISKSAGQGLSTEENQRHEEVPLPGTTETLEVTLVLHDRAGDVSFDCSVVQHGRTKVYRVATRYGRKWKATTALMFVLEGLLATGAYFAIDDATPEDRLGWILLTGWMGIDAVGTGILFFAPRKDVYDTHEKDSRIDVRSDCPEGLALEIDGRPVPINAVGKVGALGQALLEQYMTDSSPGQPALRLRAGEHSAEMYLDAADRCTWAQKRGHESVRTLCEAMPQAEGSSSQQRNTVTVVMEVPLGTFTGPPPPPPAEPAPEPSEAATESPLEPWAPPSPTAPEP